jgi:molybdate transport system substrate-binding protein
VLTVAAASDLGPAFQELGAAFQRETGQAPRFTFGSTGLLAKQLHEGGPFDVFAAANVQYTDDAVRAGDCDAATKALYARGRIALWTRAEVAVPASLSDLGDARYGKIAIANPEHAPYGKAAKEAMERAGVWGIVEPRIVYGENVQQTLKFAQSGNADVALVALSLVIVTRGGHHVLIDEALHRPIDQALAACRHGKNFEGGRRFAEFVNSKQGRDIMKRYGFMLPGETVARSP